MKKTKNLEKLKQFKNKCMGKLKQKNYDFIFKALGGNLTIFSTAFTALTTAVYANAGEFSPICLAGPAGMALGLSIVKFGKQIAKCESYIPTDNQISIPSGSDNNSRSVGDIIKNIEESGINFSVNIHDDEETLSR